MDTVIVINGIVYFITSYIYHSKEHRSIGAHAAGGGGFEKHCVLKILGLKRPPKAAEEKPMEHRSKSPPEAADLKNTVF